MKKFLFLSVFAVLTAAAADLSVFPEKMIHPMTGFERWQCGKDAITMLQNKPYAWSATVPVAFDASEYRYFNMELSGDRDVTAGILAIYFLNEGERSFRDNKYCRTRFSLTKDNKVVVSVPLTGNAWQGKITGFRFDLGGGKDVNWRITRMWFSEAAAPDVNGDFAVFPGTSPIRGMVGFKTFEIKDGVISAEQSRAYSYTSTFTLGIKAEEYGFFNISVETPDPVSGSLSLYFNHPGERGFADANFLRTAFSVEGGKPQIISLPLNKASWQGIIAGCRFDLSTKPGQKWVIRRVWFSKDRPAAYNNRQFYLPLAAGRSMVETRYDLLFSRRYSFSWDTAGTPGSCTVKFYDANDRLLGQVNNSGKPELFFSPPDTATYCRIEVTAGNGELSNFKLKDAGKAPGDAWQSNWICHPQIRSTKGVTYFAYRRDFDLTALPAEARIQLTADDGQYIYINGQYIGGRDSGWQQTALYTITPLLKTGKNTIEIRVRNENGPTALIAEVRLDMPDGQTVVIPSDKNYIVVPIEDKIVPGGVDYSGAVAACELGIPPIAPWHSVAYFALKRRVPFQMTEQNLKFENGRITGSIKLQNLNDGTIQLQISGGNTIYGRYQANIRNSIAEVDIDVADLHLFPGDYTLFPDPQSFAGDTPVLTFTIPRSPAETVPRFSMDSSRGYVQLMRNGEPVWMGLFKSARESQLSGAYWQANYRILFFGTAMGGSSGSNSGRYWLGPQRYDFTDIDTRLEAFLRRYPDALLIVTAGIDGPKWWCDAHPEECVWFENSGHPEGLTSPASAQWRQEALPAFRELIRHMEKSPYASRIIGYRIQAHCDGGEFQYLGTWQNKYADYSPAMQQYFRQFLRNRYQTDAALQRAWNDPAVTLDTAQIPTGKERGAAEFFVFRDADKARNVMDFTDCLSDAMVTAAMDFLKIVREEAPEKLSGLYGGYVFFYSGHQLLNSSHANYGKLYRSRLADFICSPQDYFQRLVGWPGGHHGPSVGTQLYNLSYMDENDTRTILCAPGGYRHVDSMHETIGVLKRDFILQLTKGLGNIFYDLAGGWFENDAMLDAMRVMNEIGTMAQNIPGFRRGQAAFLYDAGSIHRLSLANTPIIDAIRRDMRRNLGWSGITTDQYLLEDLMQDNFPEYDCYILPNVFAPSEAMRQLIASKLNKPGKLIIFGYAPGAFRENAGKIDLEAMRELTGINFGVTMEEEKRQVRLNDGTSFGDGSQFGPAFYIDDPSVEVLGRFTRNNRVAIARKQLPSGATVIVTMLPEMTPALFRSIFRQQNIHIFCDTDDPVYFDGRFVAIHANISGKKVLRLPETRPVYDPFRKKVVSNGTQVIELEMERGQTEIFMLSIPQ